MRLRLHLERNALPATQALWPVKDRKSTIAQLLQHINEVFPLESGQWGLEDYKVSVGGFECLHYQILEEILKEDEEVTVKPLQWVDVRARTVTGRNQISPDGRHMVDGVPFGRNMVTKPMRPDLVIPPRKKRKLLGGVTEVESETDARAARYLQTENGVGLDDDEDDEDEEVDGDYEEGEANGHYSSDDSSSSSDSDDAADESSSSDTDSTSDDSDDAPSEHTSKPTMATVPPPKANAAPPPSSKKNDNTPSAGAGTKRKRGVQDEGERIDESHNSDVRNSLPGAGLSKTQDRNARRRDSKKLKKLKDMGILPAKAILSDLREWESTRPGEEQLPPEDFEMQDPAAGHKWSLTLAGNDGLHDDITDSATGAGAEIAETPEHDQKISIPLSKRQKKKQKKAATESAMAIQEERQKLLSAIEAGGIDVTESTKTHKQSKKPDLSAQLELQVAAEQNSALLSAVLETVPQSDGTTEESTPASTPRRARLNVPGFERMIFGSLGVRTPKTQEERDRLKEKLSNSSKGKNPAAEICDNTNGISQPEQAAAAMETEQQDENYPWWDKIHLTAVECCEEGVELSTPPFPFYQRWDPTQRLYNKKKRKQGQLGGKYVDGKLRKKIKMGDVVETYDKYNTNGEGDALNYDEAEDADEDEEYWEEGALLDGDVTESEIEDDGFPTLPDKLDDLAPLSEDDAAKDNFIAYAELACDESTGWQPKSVNRLAKVVECKDVEGEGKLWVLQMSSRDREARAFDEDGNRVYSKFQMPDEDEDEAEDDGVREVKWNELGDVKLVLKAGGAVDGAAVVGDGGD